MCKQKDMMNFWVCNCFPVLACPIFESGGVVHCLCVCVFVVVGGVGGGFRVVGWFWGSFCCCVCVCVWGGGGVACLLLGVFVVVIVWFWLCVCVWGGGGGGLYDFFISCCWEYYVDTFRVKGEVCFIDFMVSWVTFLLLFSRRLEVGGGSDYGIYFYLSNLRFDKMFTGLCDTLPLLVMKFSFNPRNSIILNAGAKLQLQMFSCTFTCLVNHFSRVHLLYDCILPWRTITVDYLFPNPSYKLIRPNNILLCSDWFLYPFTLGVYVAVKILFRCAPL